MAEVKLEEEDGVDEGERWRDVSDLHEDEEDYGD